MKQIKRVVAALFVLCVALVLAFGPHADVAPVKDRIIIDYWEKWTGAEADQMLQIVDWFNQTVGKEKGIYVRYLSMSSVNQKTLVATAAGAPPDIAGLWDTQVAQFAATDAVIPLDELAREHGITEGYYKPVYWKGCHYRGKLYALVTNPMAVALHYNRQYFQDHAQRLRMAGLDPDRAPRTLDELDRYAQALDEIVRQPNGATTIRSAGYLPLEPGWYIANTGLWFGIQPYDEATDTIQLDHPRMIQAYEWIGSYSRRLGMVATSDFRSGLGNFNSTQNPFLVDQVAMVQQGPWMANYIENLKPAWNRWKFSKELEKGMSVAQRKQNYVWAAAAFPSAVPGLQDVTYAAFDMMVIPRGSKHPREAFEFIAFVNRQDVMEKLCSLHCENSPLTKVSDEFIRNHPNPYIDVFERLAASPNAQGASPVAIWPQIGDELTNAATRVNLQQASAREALADAQIRIKGDYERFKKIQRLRKEGER